MFDPSGLYLLVVIAVILFLVSLLFFVFAFLEHLNKLSMDRMRELYERGEKKQLTFKKNKV